MHSIFPTVVEKPPRTGTTNTSVSSIMGNVGDTKTSTFNNLTRGRLSAGESVLITINASMMRKSRKVQSALELTFTDTFMK